MGKVTSSGAFFDRVRQPEALVAFERPLCPLYLLSLTLLVQCRYEYYRFPENYFA